MRPIKFRGKDIMDDHWVYGDLHILCDRPHIHTEPTAYPYAGRRSFIAPETIGQFTGLKDKNGREIYEGDIIAARGMVEKLEVRFVRGVFAFLWNGNLDDEFPTGSPTHEWAEVVGNVFDNPEMLEKGGKQ